MSFFLITCRYTLFKILISNYATFARITQHPTSANTKRNQRSLSRIDPRLSNIENGNILVNNRSPFSKSPLPSFIITHRGHFAQTRGRSRHHIAHQSGSRTLIWIRWCNDKCRGTMHFVTHPEASRHALASRVSSSSGGFHSRGREWEWCVCAYDAHIVRDLRYEIAVISMLMMNFLIRFLKNSDLVMFHSNYVNYMQQVFCFAYSEFWIHVFFKDNLNSFNLDNKIF